MIPGHPAFCSRVGPWGTCPHPERGQSAAAPLGGIATHWQRLRLRQSVRDAAGSEEGGIAQPNLWREGSASNKIQSAKRLAQFWNKSGIDTPSFWSRFYLWEKTTIKQACDYI